MLKKEITYIDTFAEDQPEVTETLYFNLTKAEVLEFKFKFEAGLDEIIKNMIAAEDNQGVFDELKKIILGTYGERMEVNGRHIFRKNDEIVEAFAQSAAFDAFIWELINSGEQGIVDFLANVVPAEFLENVDLTAVLRDGVEIVEEVRTNVFDNPPQLPKE